VRTKVNKIQWIYEGESGYWHSSEHRFEIEPYGFRGGVTPDYYTLTDRMGGNSTKADTVGELKAYALDAINQQEQKYYH